MKKKIIISLFAVTICICPKVVVRLRGMGADKILNERTVQMYSPELGAQALGQAVQEIKRENCLFGKDPRPLLGLAGLSRQEPCDLDDQYVRFVSQEMGIMHRACPEVFPHPSRCFVKVYYKATIVPVRPEELDRRRLLEYATEVCEGRRQFVDLNYVCPQTSQNHVTNMIYYKDEHGSLKLIGYYQRSELILLLPLGLVITGENDEVLSKITRLINAQELNFTILETLCREFLTLDKASEAELKVSEGFKNYAHVLIWMNSQFSKPFFGGMLSPVLKILKQGLENPQTPFILTQRQEDDKRMHSLLDMCPHVKMTHELRFLSDQVSESEFGRADRDMVLQFDESESLGEVLLCCERKGDQIILTLRGDTTLVELVLQVFGENKISGKISPYHALELMRQVLEQRKENERELFKSIADW